MTMAKQSTKGNCRKERMNEWKRKKECMKESKMSFVAKQENYHVATKTIM